MNNKALARQGIFSVLILSIIFLLFLIPYSASYGGIEHQYYRVGDSIKFDFSNIGYYVKVVTPTTSFVKQGNDDKFSFKLVENGKYSFFITIDGTLERKDIYVGTEAEIAKQKSLTLNNFSDTSDNLEAYNNNFPNVNKINKKEIKIYPESNISFGTLNTEKNKNFTTSIELEVVQKENIRIFWKEKNKYVNFNTNQNDSGHIVNISWEVNNFELQTYEIIIVITKAEHLDANRTFIRDVYEFVKEKDNIWSGPINSGEFVRITFEKKLTNVNDITIYPRIVSGNPTIEVYEIESNVKIAEFSSLNDNAYNKVYLTLLNDEQDVFDLKIVGGIIEFDHIIDPTPKVFPTGLRNGVFVVSNSTSQNPNYFIWNGSNWSSRYEALAVGGVPEWMTVRAGVTRDEYIIATADNVDDINIQINFTNSSGQKCWGNGTACNVVWEVNATSTTANVQKVDVAYSHKSGNALVVWSDNSRRPLFTVWNGSFWSRPRAINDTAVSNIGDLALTGANIETIQLAARTNNSDEIALLMTDSNDDAAVVIWNGTGFDCESPVLSINLGTTNVQKADLDYEDLSGDLFVASILSATSFNITTKAADTCTFVSSTRSVLNAVWMDVAAQPGTDNIMLAGSTGGNTDDMNAQVWRGSAWGNVSAEDTAIYAAAVSPNNVFSAAWAGLKAGLVVYSDAAVNTVVDFFLFDSDSMSWQGTPAVDFTPTPAFSTTGEANIKAYSFMDENKTIAFFMDANTTHTKVWAKIYDADTNTWANTEPAQQPLIWDAASTTTFFPSFDFTWQKYVTPPPISIVYPGNITYSDNVSQLNYTFSGNAQYCWYSLDNGLTNSSPNSCGQNFTDIVSNEGSNFWTLYVNDSVGAWDSTNVTFFKDSIFPLIYFEANTEENNSIKTTAIIRINISYSDDNIANATIYVFNSTHNLVRNTTSTSSPNFTQYSGLPDGIYYFNATVYDIASNINHTETRQLLIDTTYPILQITHPQPSNYTYLIDAINYTYIENNPSYCWYSLNGGNINSSIVSCGENFSLLSANEGDNIWTVYMNDSAGLENSTNVSFFIDTINPGIRFIPPTPLNGTSRDEQSIYVEVEVIETNFANITYILANNSNVINVTTFNTLVTSINWTGLNNSNVRYFYNVSMYDVLSNYNDTGTRVINLTLGDIAPPDIFFNVPLFNNDYINYSNINLNVTLSEEARNVSYSFNYGQLNYSMSNLTLFDYNSSVNLSDGFYQLTVYARDYANNSGSRSRNFTVDTIYPKINYGVGTEEDGAYASRDWIYVNVSVEELNEGAINFSLFNDFGLINSQYFTDGTKEVNWTSLVQGVYYYNVTFVDLAGNYNVTENRNITLDLVVPSVVLNNPLNESYQNVSIVNLTVNASDNLFLSNLTLEVFNITGDLINRTTVSTELQDSSFGILFYFPYDGNFTWSYLVSDKAGNYNLSEYNAIIIDTTSPLYTFGTGTDNNNVERERDWIYLNVSAQELNFANITYRLYNSTHLVNETIYYINNLVINWTELNSRNITYSYNATIYDLAGNSNNTQTRTIKLIDITSPSILIAEPLNKTYYFNESLPLTYSVSDVHLSNCWYNIDNLVNRSLDCSGATTFNVSEGQHTLYLYANDSLGLLGRANVTFVANESLLPKIKGILAYGEGNSAPAPVRLRYWDGTNFSLERSALNVGGVPEWVKVKNAPSRDEQMLVIANTLDDVSVQINGSLNGQSCWNNGTNCNTYLNLTTSSTTINRQKADVSYETLTGDALVVFSQNNQTPLYRVWNGTHWTSNIPVPQTLLRGGIVSYLKMESHPFSDEIALIMSNTTNLNVIIWNGTEWTCELPSLRPGLLTPDVYQHADLAYEQVSGDLFIAHTVDGATEVDYTTKSNGLCNYNTLRTNTLAEEGEIITANARYGSNHIMITQEDVGGSDMESIGWDGSSLLALSGNEQTLYATVASPNLLISNAWVGTSNHALVVYSDAATSLNLDYFRYNISNNVWEGGTAGLNAAGLTNFFDEEQNIKSYSFVERNRTMIIVQDDGDRLWAKYYDGDTNTFGQFDSGVAYETTVSSTSFPAFDFEFNNDRAGPDIYLPELNYYLNDSIVEFNITLGEDSSTCTYSLDGGLNFSMVQNTKRNFYSQLNINDGEHEVIFTCSDLFLNYRQTMREFIVDTTKPALSFAGGTASNDSQIQADYIYLNMSLVEANFANITYTLFNQTNIINTTLYDVETLEINWSGLPGGIYYYNVSVYDLANNFDRTETRIINLTRTSPIVNLISPVNYYNNSGYVINGFNFTVVGNATIVNCSLYGTWSGTWAINQTINYPVQGQMLSFNSIDVGDDGYYNWNVYCYDYLNVLGYNNTNYSFAAFLPALNPSNINITQSTNNGSGNVTIVWQASNHADYYKVYYSTNTTHFVLLNITNSTNYTDSTFSGNKRRFYTVSAWNPIYENYSSDIFAAQVFTLSQTTNTRNWIGFIANTSFVDANGALNEINNITAVTMWNTTKQKAVTCNEFSCPNYPLCTDTNCNFEISQGSAYEVNLNSSASINWSSVGKLYSYSNITLVKNSTSSGKNWVSIYPGSKYLNAQTILGNISRADAVTRWNAQTQSSQGYIPSPLPVGPRYIGTNFNIIFEEGYEISVNQTINMSFV